MMTKVRFLFLIALLVTLFGVSIVAAQEDMEYHWPLRGEYPISEEPVTLTVMVGQGSGVEDITTNALTAWFEELTNVHIEWQVVPADAEPEALSLTLASGDLPDVILSFGIPLSSLSVYGAQGLFIPLNDLIEQYGVNTRAVFEEVPTVRGEVTSPDGNIYGLPYVNVCYHCSAAQKMWINQTWLDALGLAMPQTTEEFRDVLIAFRDGDPNGNGVQDEVPLTGSPTGWMNELRGYLINPFILNSPFFDNPGLYLDNGQIKANFTTEEYHEALRYIRSLYDEGLFGSEALTQGSETLVQMGENPEGNQVGAAPGGYQGTFTEVGAESGRWLNYVTVPPLEGPEGNRVAPWDPYAFSAGAFVITSAAENPEIAFRWGDAFFEWEIQTRRVYGIQGENWDYAPEGMIGLNGEPACRVMITPYGDVQNNHWYETGPEYLSGEFRLCEGYDEQNSGAQLERILYDQTAQNYAPYAAPLEITVPRLTLSEDAASESSEQWAGIDSYANEMFAQFVTGQADLDADWETYLQTLDELGLPRYLEIRQAAFDEQYAGNWPPSE